MPNENTLAAESAGMQFGTRWLWRDLTFALEPGIRLGLVGPTGAGKTILLRCLVGLTALDEGRVVLDGRPLDEWHVPAYRSAVSYLAQTPSLIEGTVEDNIRLALRFRSHANRVYQPGTAIDALGRVGRDASFLRASASDLSGGERQIVALLRALLLEPRILLLDEPTANLDPASTRQLEQLVHEWHVRSSHRAVLWTTHDPTQIERVANQRIVLGSGTTGNAQ